MIEYGIKNLLTGKIVRTNMSEQQADSLIKVHLEDVEEDDKTPYLVKISRVIADWN